MIRAAPPKAAMDPLQRARARLSAAMQAHQASLDAAAPRQPPLEHAIAAALRVRPLLPAEAARGLFAGIHVRGPLAVVYHPIKSTFASLALETHTFDNVDAAFGPDDAAEDVYASVARPALAFAADQGGLATVIAYGQTGAGKTHTISAMHRLLPIDLFPNYADRFRITVSFFEIYGTQVTDLLRDGAPLEIRSVPDVGTIVVGAAQIHVNSHDEFLAAVGRGTEHRRTRATFKNDQSSRSHAICAVSLHRGPPPPADQYPLVLGAHTLLLVDLAGSERASDQEYHDTERIREAQLVNASLMTLKECIRARHQIALGAKNHIHIPFRTSKLTLVLKEALDPQATVPSRTVLLGHLAPALADSQHSLSTARYVSQLKASADSIAAGGSKVTGRAHAAAPPPNPHPSVWTYKKLASKFKTWSNNAIDLTRIVPFHASSGRLQDMGMGEMPAWMKIAQMPRAEWCAKCAALGVTEATASRAFEKYQVELRSGREIVGKAAAEHTGVVLLQ